MLSVLIVTAVGIVLSVVLLLLSVNFSRSSLVLEKFFQAKALADACAEEALQQINDRVSYSGSASLTLGQGSCSYTVTKLTGQNRTITASGIVGTVVRKLAISLDKVNPSLNIASWQEVP